MRNELRIDKFLDLVDNRKLLLDIFKLDIDKTTTSIDFILDLIDSIKSYWHENTDLRYTQVLVNLGIVPNTPGFWYYLEEDEILEQQGVDLAKFMRWGVNFDKEMNRLPKTDYRLICDMATDHIETILSGQWTKHPRYIRVFETELKRRKDAGE